MSSANTIAVRNGGEALHMDSKETGERSSLNLADLGKALGYMCYRAVMLAKLFTDRRRQGGRNIPVF
jgi:enhancing lycopene biosynthesis protein 2